MSSTNKTIGEKTAELTKMVEWFDGDEFTLEMALDKYKSAEKLATEIGQDLSSLKNDIQVIKQKFDSEK
jgi:exonuclease VII small subunit